jgi:hypothetical protein
MKGKKCPENGAEETHSPFSSMSDSPRSSARIVLVVKVRRKRDSAKVLRLVMIYPRKE